MKKCNFLQKRNPIKSRRKRNKIEFGFVINLVNNHSELAFLLYKGSLLLLEDHYGVSSDCYKELSAKLDDGCEKFVSDLPHTLSSVLSACSICLFIVNVSHQNQTIGTNVKMGHVISDLLQQSTFRKR